VLPNDAKPAPNKFNPNFPAETNIRTLVCVIFVAPFVYVMSIFASDDWFIEKNQSSMKYRFNP
jgi:hypothetical protein